MNEFNSCRSKRASIINYSKIWLDTFGASINRGRRRSSVSTSLFMAKDPIITDYSKSEDFDKIHKHDHSSKPHIHDSNNFFKPYFSAAGEKIASFSTFDLL